MEELNRSIDKKPPERLYHYTSIDGLKGILDSRCLFASQIHFLNDTQEFKYSFDILKEVIPEFKSHFPRKRAVPLFSLKPEEWTTFNCYDLIEDLYFGSDLLTKTPVCVFSFSESRDLLSQWRAYCPPNGGYSIGFRSDSLIPWLKAKKLLLEPCIYDRAEQETIIRNEFNKKNDLLMKQIDILEESEEIEKITRVTQEIEQFMIDFYMRFSQIASQLKHPAFREECEWRIISEPINNKQMSFRVKKSVFLPYLEIDFTDIEPFPIDEIIVGPAPEQHLARLSLQQFLLKKDLKKILIKDSSTPYRELM